MQLDPRLTRPIEWDLPYLTGRGLTSLLYAHPGVGKSTVGTNYVRAKASGGTFLGAELEPASVLVVAPDEPDRIRLMRYVELGVNREHVHDWNHSSCTVPEIAEEAHALGVGLVVADTLPKVARVSNENDSAEWESWFAENQPVARELDVPWLFFDHARKSGGEYGEDLRGASAKLGNLDICVKLSRVDGNRLQRRLTWSKSRIEVQPAQLLELRDDGLLHLLGSAWKERIHSDVECQRILAVLEDGEPRTAAEVWHELGRTPARATVYRRMRDQLVPARLVEVVSDEPFAVKAFTRVHCSPLRGCEQVNSRGEP
jgi:hypothetical protein